MITAIQSLIHPRPIDPFRVVPSMIDDGALYYQNQEGVYFQVTSFERITETRMTSNGTPYPFVMSFRVLYGESGEAIFFAFGEDDAPLFLEQMPKVGMGATLHYPNDRYPYTVIEVVDDSHLIVQADEIDHVSGNFRDGNVVWKPVRNTTGRMYSLRWTDKHGWRSKPGNTSFSVGSRDYYMSPEI